MVYANLEAVVEMLVQPPLIVAVVVVMVELSEVLHFVCLLVDEVYFASPIPFLATVRWLE